MEIQQVIKRADELFPNPYTEEEKCRWCDELGAMLTRDYKKPFGREIFTAENGELFLPKYIDFADIERVEYAGRVIPKRDMRALGIKILYNLNGKGAVKIPEYYTGEVTVSYLEKYEPIRNINVKKTTVEIKPVGSIMTQIPSFREEDILKVTVDGTAYDDVYVFGVELTPWVVPLDQPTSYGYELETQEGACGKLNGGYTADIYRYLTDETVCPAPYDAMYIHFLCAKANFYQRDFDAYNQETAIVNTLMDAYARELKNRAPVDNDGQFMNWW